MPGFEIFGEEERREVNEVLETGVLFRYGFEPLRKGRFKAITFERELSQKVGVGYSHLCSSGTAALSIALASCGVGAGDEVVVPPFTFIATIEAVLNAGAIPVFSEIDETLCLNPEAIENVLTSRTKAVLPVHMCGAMADIEKIKGLCEAKGLVLIEDACQSLGGSYGGKALGSFGSMGCFSFDYVKTITCGEGGAVITNNKELYLKADAYSDHGHDHIGDDRGKETHPILGANYRISELSAAIGIAQLRKLDYILQTQRTHKKVIKDAMAEIPGISFRTLPDADGDSATFLCFFMPDEQTARRATKELGKMGVDGCFYWYDNNWHYIRQWDHLKKMTTAARLPIEIYENRPDYENIDLPASDNIMGRLISMQIKLTWTKQELDERAGKIVDALEQSL